MNIDFALKIVRLFSGDVSIEFTILDVSKKSGLSYNAAHRTVQELVRRGILSVRKIGPVSLVSLLKNSSSYGYLVLANASAEKSEVQLIEGVNAAWEGK